MNTWNRCHMDTQQRTKKVAIITYKALNWLVVSTHLKNIRQNGNLPQFSGWKFKTCLSCHHLVNIHRYPWHCAQIGIVWIVHHTPPKPGDFKDGIWPASFFTSFPCIHLVLHLWKLKVLEPEISSKKNMPALEIIPEIIILYHVHIIFSYISSLLF